MPPTHRTRLALAALLTVSLLAIGLPWANAATTSNLDLTFGGAGNGTVVSSIPDTNGMSSCTSDCTFVFNITDMPSLSADPANTSDFNQWGGDCNGGGTCDLTMLVDHNVTAFFALGPQLTVGSGGAGSGTVTSSPAGINCGSNCTQNYTTGTDVDLIPDADPGSSFDHWNGDCSGGGGCHVTMNADRDVTAVFTLDQFTLTVDTSGTGTGTVTSSPAGINCPSNCTQDYDPGTSVDLTPDPDVSSVFNHWNGDCTGSGACSVTMNGARSVTGVFTLKTHTLTVDTSGNGTGSVTSSPGGINCPSNCTQDYDHGTDVTLTPAADNSSTFDHWTGDCTGGGGCTVTMNAARDVTAVFTLKLRSLDVSTTGTGSGTVTSSPGGINCPSNCSHNYNHGTDVTLTATPAAGSVFDHWSTDCLGPATTCDLHMGQDKTVGAKFTLRQFTLTLSKAGDGQGLVTGTPAGMNCRIPCTGVMATYDYGTTVTLRTAPAWGSRFMGWRGACTGRAACVIDITSRRTVTAVFASVCGRVAFVSTRSGNDDIWIMNPNGTRATDLSQNPADDSDVAWSPDCSQIAFTSDRGGNQDIWVMHNDGTHLHRVTSSPADDSQPTWAPGGNRIAYTRSIGENGDLYVVAPDGTHGRQLTSGPADDFRPDWSPNGRRIMFVSTRGVGEQQIFTMSAGGGHLVQLTHSTGQNLQPAWAPSGRRIAFVSTRDGNRELYLADASGRGVIRLTHNPGIDAHPSFSPGGAKITFYTTRAGNDEVFEINANGTHAVNVSRNPASDTGPVWSS
jgi:Tol biopolymer transport system component